MHDLVIRNVRVADVGNIEGEEYVDLCRAAGRILARFTGNTPTVGMTRS